MLRVLVARSGLVRHELALVDINYRKAMDEAIQAGRCTPTTCEAFKPSLPPTVLVDYINPAVATDQDLLPFAGNSTPAFAANTAK